MEYQQYPAQSLQPRTNQLALWSGILGIAGWVFILLNYCLGAIFTLITLGIGSICIMGVQCIIPILWIIGVILGHVGLGQVNRTGESGKGWAVTGLILGYLGLLSVLVLVVLVILGVAAGVSIPLISTLFSGNTY